MKVNVAKVHRKNIGKVDVDVTITTHGRQPQTIKITDLQEPIKFEIHPVGMLKNKDGEWVWPYEEVDGEWVNKPLNEAELVQVPLTDEELLTLARPHLRDFHHKHVVDHCNDVGFTEYEDGGIRVVPKTPVKLNKRGTVEVEIEAYEISSGKKLDVHDGIFQFDRPPLTLDGVDNPAERLKVELARVIRQRNGLE